MTAGFALTFPVFDIYSTPLLLLMLQGLVIVCMLLIRGRKTNAIADLLLASIVLLTCYERTHYAIGFMEWYDTYRTTKINYFLPDSTLLLAPLIYLYITAITTYKFKLLKKHFWHFAAWIVYVAYWAFLYVYDAKQPDFDQTQNGLLMRELHFKYVSPLLFVLVNFSMTLYLAFSLQRYFKYRSIINQYYSNTYKLELNWIRNFLLIYSVLFVYLLLQTLIDAAIVDLHWTQEWYYHLLSAVVVIYVGIKGYFTNVGALTELSGLAPFSNKISSPEAPIQKTTAQSDQQTAAFLTYMEQNKPYLQPELTLSQLAIAYKISRAELSELLNKGLGKNFNDFINSYRINTFKELIDRGKLTQMSILGIALESGFNSKATFNRVFKKHTGQSPTEYIKSL